jgi:outer membrane protein insertion porin family
VALAFFADTGMNMAVRQSQLRLSDQQFSQLDATPFGCPAPPVVTEINNQVTATCTETQLLKFNQNLTPLPHTNYVVRMSTGAELQVILPVVNAPFRLYYAYNPLRVDTEALAPNFITPEMFPNDGNCATETPERCLTGAGYYTYKNTIATYNPSYRIREPRKTFRFTVATTF